ncbi:restriction endonuclease subunit S [uncultured Sphingomonas sp.]|uniref:restriction endonuclease subunit S n=1 Tax=uncultured Sphingomonas sp. TaxID=158754 RepID=UPI0035CBD465
MAGWRECPLGDVIELKRGYDLPKQSRTAGLVPLVSSSGISGRISEAKIASPGVVTGRYGTIGQVFFIDEPFWPLNTTLYVRDFKGNDPRFIGYFLSLIDFMAYSDKAAVPGLNRNHLHQAVVRLPTSRDEQAAIAGVLSALDDKIKLNRRMNETLEASARALFRNWFVDFGPTRAKAQGRPAYLAPDLWSLFPERLSDNGVPEGWGLARLTDHATVTKGRSYSSAELSPSTTALVTLKSFERGGGYRRDGLKPYTGKYNDEQVVSDGEIVISQTDVTQAAELIGRPARVIGDVRFGRLVASLDVAILRPEPRSYLDREFLFGLTDSNDFTRHALAHTSGTTVLHLAKNAIPSFGFAIPSVELVAAHRERVAAIVWKIAQNVQESDALTATRDALLPKLMSGELRVRDAEALAA